jgi:hypothetical protein
MRRLAIVVAIVSLSITSRAGADPFENISNRLEQYDQQTQGRSSQRSEGEETVSSRPLQMQRQRSELGMQAEQNQHSVRQASAQQYSSRPMNGRPMNGRPMNGRPMNARPMNGRPMASQAQYRDRPVRQAQATTREEIQPEPMPQTQYEESYDGYDAGEVWEDPTGYCDDGSCGMGCGWCRPGFWGRAEYLAWWVRGANTPPLVTTSPDGTSVGSAGVLPNATILFGDQQINDKARSGGRFTLGYWFDDCQTLGIENTFFFIGGSNDGYNASSSGSPILARPFFNTDTGNNDAILLAYPGVVAGGINISSSRSIYSNELNLRRGLYEDCCRRVDVLAGYRYMRLGETLDINTNSTDLQSAEEGAQFLATDQFSTNNNFNGGQLGLNLQFTRGCWTWDFLGKVALGGVSQRARINGSTTITQGGDSNTYSGGILALPSNIGQHDQTVFGVLPEFGVNLRYQWTPLWRVNIGYTFMALTNVLRPGDQISLSIDPDQIPPGTAANFPQYNFNQSDVWLQGINFGVECNF